MDKRKIIAVDFDGCLVIDNFPGIGEPIYETIEALKAEQDAGARVILWTCRRDDKLAAAVEWCARRGIQLAAINKNLPESIAHFGGDTVKVFADIYLDDRAVNTTQLLHNEYWRDIPGYEGFYKISSHGKVKNARRGNILATPQNHDGYSVVHLSRDGKMASRLVHVLVAKAFLPYLHAYPFVNHKDLNKQNNRVDNLEWCTHQQNCQHRSANATWTKRVTINGNTITLTDLSCVTGEKRDTMKHRLARLGEAGFIENMMSIHGEKLNQYWSECCGIEKQKKK